MNYTKSFSFPLDVENGWPPVAVEGLVFNVLDVGYELLVPPLFLKGLSVNDIIVIDEVENELVWKWHHISTSKRTTLWILNLQRDQPIAEDTASKLRTIGCITASLPMYGCFSVDVPEEIPIQKIDEILDNLDKDFCAVAFPSMRHPE